MQNVQKKRSHWGNSIVCIDSEGKINGHSWKQRALVGQGKNSAYNYPKVDHPLISLLGSGDLR